MLLKCEMKGSHLSWNFSVEPLIVNFIFSSLRKNIMSVSQVDISGGEGDFHISRILLRAIRAAKATTSALLVCKFGVSLGTPKMAM